MSTLPHLFDQWAPTYDEQTNPLLALEERTLPTLMPEIKGIDVLDIGCGTGRWLQRLERFEPASLAGVDCSTAMLARAGAKLSATTSLYLGDASSLPFENQSCDLILASFVLGYLDDLVAFAQECSRILRPGGTLLLSDMHPGTAIERNWSRTFQAGSTRIDLPTAHHAMHHVIHTFAHVGLTLHQQAEPVFAAPERPLFERAGKLHDYAALTEVPAIYLLRLQKKAPPHLQLINAPWAANASAWNVSTLSIEDGLITTNSTSLPALDLTGYVLLPGLINAHDHLEFALFPNLGRTRQEPPYNNATEWAHEIHIRHAAAIARHLRVPLATRLWWGAIRNLLCGVTTVCHHNPHHAELDALNFPIRVASSIGWSHSLTFATDLVGDHRSTPAGRPFVLHAAEGTDATSRAELYELDRLGLLDTRTILIHALSLQTSEIAVLNQRGTSVILCPTSNAFLFNQTMPLHLLAAIDRAALGSDSPLTAAGDLLDEVQSLRNKQAVDSTVIYHLLTTSPADLFHLHAGSITPNAPADLIAVRDTGRTPAERMSHLTFAEIDLVLLGGVVQVASPTLYARLPPSHRIGLEGLSVEGHTRYIRAPLTPLFQEAQAVLGSNIRLGNKEVRHLPTP